MESVELTTVNGAAPARQTGEDVTSLMQFIVEHGGNVEMLERLVALKERTEERNARAEFVKALAAFREDCPPIHKTRENTQFQVTRAGGKRNARYAPLEEIDKVARPVAAKHGLTWTWDTRIEGQLIQVSCRVMHVMGHSEITNVAMPFESRAGSSAQQKFGSAQTYGMRYSLIAALGLTMADEDVDGAGGDDLAISEQQAADLDALIEEVGADRVGFLRYMDVEKVADIKNTDYRRAVNSLERKRKVAR